MANLTCALRGGVRWGIVLAVLGGAAGLAEDARAEACAGASRAHDFSWMRGINYTPSYAQNSVMTWRDFDADVVERELGWARALGTNVVRVFLQYVVYEHDPAKFLQNFDTLLTLADRHGIQVMPVLFDSCFGKEPRITHSGRWVANPGYSRITEAWWPQLGQYLQDVVGSHVNDERIVMWDVCNEPGCDLRVVTPEGAQRILAFVYWACDEVRTLDDSHPITVGTVGGALLTEVFESKVDVLSMHTYEANPRFFRELLEQHRRFGVLYGKPAIITECGAPGRLQDYQEILPIIRDVGMGYCVWELMIANQFQRYTGILYPDGSARRLSHVAALLDRPVHELAGFPLTADPQGVPLLPLRLRPIDERTLSSLEDMVATPTDSESFDRRLLEAAAIGFSLLGAFTEPEFALMAAGWVGAHVAFTEGRWSHAFDKIDAILGVLLTRSQSVLTPG